MPGLEKKFLQGQQARNQGSLILDRCLKSFCPAFLAHICYLHTKCLIVKVILIILSIMLKVTCSTRHVPTNVDFRGFQIDNCLVQICLNCLYKQVKWAQNTYGTSWHIKCKIKVSNMECVSTGAADAQTRRSLGHHPLHPQILKLRALFYRTDCTRRSKFLKHALSNAGVQYQRFDTP